MWDMMEASEEKAMSLGLIWLSKIEMENQKFIKELGFLFL